MRPLLHGGLTMRTVAVAFFIGLAALPLWVVAGSHSSFDYTQAWVSAHYATMARAFVDFGVSGLGGLPVQNNGPLTTEPDFYLNWPPLFPIALAELERVIGDVPLHFHFLMAALATVTAGLLACIVGRIFGAGPGFLSAATFLLMPITLRFGFGVFHVHAALLLGILALYLWYLWIDTRKIPFLLGAAAVMALAVGTSWEPLLLAPGVLLAILLDRDRLRLLRGAVIVGIGAAAGLIAVIGTYVARAPWVLEQLKARLAQRSGFGEYAVDHFRVHGLEEYFEPPQSVGRLSWVLHIFYERSEFLGAVALLALALLPVLLISLRGDTRYSRVRHIVLPLLSVWLVWVFLLRQHFVVHEYQTVIAAPMAAVALGICAAFLRDCAEIVGRRNFRAAMMSIYYVVLPMVLAIGALGSMISTAQDRSSHMEMEFGKFIDRSTEPNSIVLTSERSMVPVYYARRHVIRAIADADVIIDHWNTFRNLCAECIIYLAIPDSSNSSFASLLSSRRPVASRDSAVIYRLAGPNQRLFDE